MTVLSLVFYIELSQFTRK